MYIALEGIDTAGKSTQIERLGNYFSDALVTKEPGGTDIGMQIREMVLHGNVQSPTTELLLFLADRSEHIERVIKPHREKMIISDRSLVSGIAYAMVKKTHAVDELIALNRFAVDNILPDMVVVLQLSADELASRLSQKEHDKIESRGITYLLEIQTALVEASKKLNIPCHIIDASLPIDVITEKIITFTKGEA